MCNVYGVHPYSYTHLTISIRAFYVKEFIQRYMIKTDKMSSFFKKIVEKKNKKGKKYKELKRNSQ